MSTSTEVSFGEWLKRKRKAFDLTREDLAKQLGYSAATIRKIEDEERHPSAQVVERLAEIFNIPLNERVAFLRFARGDWKSAPIGSVENTPWLASQTHEQSDPPAPKIFLATFLFTDIEGSARLWEHAPEKMKVALQRHHEILEKAISDNGGTVFQIIGDAFCAAFSTVLSAIHATVTAQQELHQEPWDLPFSIRVRMGIHTGEAERKPDGDYASNPTLNRVTRILNAAHGGQILLSLATTDLAKDSLPANTQLRDMGEHYLKNLIHPEHLFQLTVAGLPSDFPPLNTLTHRHNLPVQVTSFIAREPEIALVHEYLLKDNIRLVTLIGPPGIGKTRLSVEAARASLQDFPDGVFFVAFAPLNDTSLIASAIAQALGFVGTKNISTAKQLKEGIGDKNLLLVLDNCEHLIEDVASLAADLLPSCSRLKILTTSRESLRIPGEWLYAVPAFDLPTDSSSLDMESASTYPALMLFAERARAVRSDFSLNADNLETIAEICARLDGLPLVIELIAARMRLVTPQTLLERLSGQFVLTADGMRAASERQKTLRNAIDWSYNLLPPEEQKLFAYLSVFSGSFTLEAVEVLFSQSISEQPLANLLALLLDKSLLKLSPDPKDPDAARYTMLVTIREYARERLQEMGKETEIRNEHLAHFLALAEKADSKLRGHYQLEWLRRLESDRENLRSALDWAIETGQTEQALQMACNLHWFWFVRGDHTEGQQWLQRVLDLPNAGRFPKSQVEALIQLAHHTWLQTGAKEARPLVEQALSEARARDDQRNTAKALAMLGLVLTFENNFVAARSTLEESKVLFQEVNDTWDYAHAVMGLALGSLMQDDRATSLALHEQALLLFRELGDRYFQSAALRHIGNLRVSQNDLAGGITALREALLLSQDLNSKWETYIVIWSFAEAVRRAEDLRRAVRLYWAAKNIAESLGAWLEEDETRFEAKLVICRAALSEAAFRKAVEQGRAMTMEQAIAYALEEN